MTITPNFREITKNAINLVSNWKLRAVGNWRKVSTLPKMLVSRETNVYIGCSTISENANEDEGVGHELHGYNNHYEPQMSGAPDPTYVRAIQRLRRYLETERAKEREGEGESKGGRDTGWDRKAAYLPRINATANVDVVYDQLDTLHTRDLAR